MDWFWSEWFWFPRNRPWGWKDLENKPDSSEYRPQLNDLHWAIPLGLGLILVRYLLDKFIVIPIALKLGLTNNRKVLPQPNPVLEDAFNNNRNPDDKTVLALSKQTDMTERAVQIWFRKRKLKDDSHKLQKFRESSYQLLFYTVFFVYGVVVLWNKPYVWKTRLCWEEWPSQHVSNGIYWYYISELAFYWSLVFTLFWDHRRKDFVEMTVHHIATIVLLNFSWVLNFVRIGSLVLVVHDSADTWLSLAKLSIYLKRKALTDIFFGIFLVVWTISRLIVYPYVILYCTTVEPYYKIIDTGATFGAHIFFNAFLYLLQILHIFWSYLIFKAAILKMIKGKVEDLRSDTEESDEDLENLGQGTVDINGTCVLNDSKSSSNNCQTASMNGGSFDRQNN